MKQTIGFLGPKGTFTEEALLRLIGNGDKLNLIPFNSIQEVIAGVESGKVDKGFVAIENSIEGSVNTTLDMLTFEAGILIEQEVIAAISHNLISRHNLTKDNINMILSHPQATAQCRKYLARNFPHARIGAANSTAEAAKLVAESLENAAAIGTRLAAEIYDLKVIDINIQDFADNQTRFVLLGRERPAHTGRDKTSLVCFIKKDRPGSLLEILQEFAKREINLTKIQSRPTRKALGEYYFFIDVEGHMEDERLADTMVVLRQKL
ncbi:MAG TPA: prephenate dehydratase, partial [Actinobacteria bacterium]|nr:prephenate dehydratase [Actinomycetes bacterium]HEX21282.1 prephenate dehydratase [Actinomycetota bacterium]